jgi:hypothetical protein
MLERSYVLSPQHEDRNSPIGSAVDNDTGSNFNVDLMKIWLHNCLKTHHSCDSREPSRALTLLPTRVIDVDTNSQARITETTGMRANYLTLSYCWGQGKKLLCRKDSYERFKQNLPVDDSMPKTFKDALQITKALGYRYLWIDALCIIQDDP